MSREQTLEVPDRVDRKRQLFGLSPIIVGRADSLKPVPSHFGPQQEIS